MAEHTHGSPGTELPLNHELSDADPSPILKFLVFLVAATIVAAVIVVFFYNYLERREAAEKTARYPMSLIGADRPMPPPPRLQTYPFQDIKELRQAEAPLLYQVRVGRQERRDGAHPDRPGNRAARGARAPVPQAGAAIRDSAGPGAGEPARREHGQRGVGCVERSAGSIETYVRAFITALLVTCLSAGTARAQSDTPSLYERQSSSQPPANKLPELLTEIGLDQRLDTQVPLDLPFKDEAGRDVRLGDYFGTRPVILTLVYYECPMLCTQVLNGLTRVLGVLSFTVGKEFDIVTVSFDPKETPELAAAKKAAYLDRYTREGAGTGWHFLTGSERSVAALTKAVGFRYAYNASIDQYAHVSGIMVLTPDGRLSRYFYGIEYGPRDVRLALVEAADRRIGTPADQLLLYCFHYDPKSARYSLAIMRLVRTLGVATALAMVAGVVILRRREPGRR